MTYDMDKPNPAKVIPHPKLVKMQQAKLDRAKAKAVLDSLVKQLGLDTGVERTTRGRDINS